MVGRYLICGELNVNFVVVVVAIVIFKIYLHSELELETKKRLLTFVVFLLSHYITSGSLSIFAAVQRLRIKTFQKKQSLHPDVKYKAIRYKLYF